MTNKNNTKDEMMTKWSQNLVMQYNAGIANSFLITGNIGDYIVYATEIMDYLIYLSTFKLDLENIYSYDLSEGLTTLEGEDITLIQDNNNENINLKETDINQFKYINEMFRTKCKKSVLIVKYPELLIDGNANFLQEEQKCNLIELHKTLNSPNFINSENIIILITESDKSLHPLLLSSNSNLTEINIELPEYDERLKFIEFKMEHMDVDNIDLQISKEVFANITAGLRLSSIEDILLLSDTTGVLNAQMAIQRKKELIEKEHGEIVEIMETKGRSLDNFAGQENIKNYFKEVVIDAVEDQNLDIVPKGILLMGPPGTGKTYFTQCLAGDAGINSVEFRMSKIKDKWVGESEKNLEKAFSVFRALAPVIVFIDELDQALGRGGEDGHSVDKGLFGMFLAELSKNENRGKIIWIGATNYPNEIDEALKRAGRFDKKIPFLAPIDKEREAIVELYINMSKMPVENINQNKRLEMIKYITDETKGFTQAEIENVFVKAQELAMRNKEKYIKFDHIKLALEYMLPSNNNKIQEMEDIALKECNDQEFIPSFYKKRHKKLFSETE